MAAGQELAAGCPVVAEVHDAHPLTSVRSPEAFAQGARSAGVQSDIVAMFTGQNRTVDAGWT